MNNDRKKVMLNVALALLCGFAWWAGYGKLEKFYEGVFWWSVGAFGVTFFIWMTDDEG